MHLKTSEGILVDSIELSPTGDIAMPGGAAFFTGYQMGDLNDDNVLDIIDVILLVSYILGNLDSYNYSLFEYASDLNSDESIDILDVIELVFIIMNND